MDARLAGNILREQARAGGQLRAQGFESARQAAQQAFEQSQARRQAAGQGIGQLGLNFGQLAQQDVGQLQNIGMGLGSLGTAAGGLGTQISSLGVQQAGLGELAQALGRQDISTLTGLGGLQRQNQQQALDALRQTRTEQLAQPFQQLGFLSDIYRGTPSSQSTVTSQAVQPPSTAQQVLGFGIAGLGALTGARQGNLLP